MANPTLQQLAASLIRFASDTRLYELKLQASSGASGEQQEAELLVEAFASSDALHLIATRDVIAISPDADLAVADLLGRSASLFISLADGSRTEFNGEITTVAMLGSDGGFARYRLRLTPWLWRLDQVRNSRVWQDKTVTEIIDDVFAAYSPLAQWRWSAETAVFMADMGARSYCCQYRESDLAFVDRLLTEEGLSWRFEHVEQAVIVVLFADSRQSSAVPEDFSSKAGGGIRFHGARAGEKSDTILSLHAKRKLRSSLTTLLSYDYKAKKALSGSAPARSLNTRLPELESFDVPGQYAYPSGALAAHYAEIRMQAQEVASQTWHGRSTVRTLSAGTRIAVTAGPLKQADGNDPVYVLLRVHSVGINNLPTSAQQALAELFGPIPELLQEVTLGAPEEFALAIEQARATGYANCFDAVAADTVWRPRPVHSHSTSDRKPTAYGAQTATVIGPDGNDQPVGADELYCDGLGRVRIRYHWQDSVATCWVRVAQRSSGGGMGSQFLPRIGQEVLVQFLENDIDRPIVVGALYNGRGEGGITQTPGGRSDDIDSAQPFSQANDHQTSGQGNLAAGNSPVWHGASPDSGGHNNGAAQWGIRTKEFGAAGYNQLLFDDTDAQGRVQLRCTFASSELNLGHLIHGADNYRGSLRGQGAELRTDAYGAVRGSAGLLITSYTISHTAGAREPAGDNAAGIALLKQAAQLGKTFSEAAAVHQTVALASHLGTTKDGGSILDDTEAPLPAMLTVLSGMVSDADLDTALEDTDEKKTKPSNRTLPHTSSPIIAVSAKAGLGLTAGQAVQLSSGDTISLMSGADTNLISGGQMRVHTGQAIGVLGGAVNPGEGGAGLQMIAAKDAVEFQAQGDKLSVRARDDVTVISANAGVDWAAAKSISLSTAGGANITIEGGNITVQAPGKMTIRAGKKSFSGPEQLDHPLPKLPRAVCVECLLKALRTGSALSLK